MTLLRPPPDTASPPWSEALDAQLRRLWAEGVPWDEIARALGRERRSVVIRAIVIGARPPPPDFSPVSHDPEREPLPAGHPRTWGALVAGTLLAGTDYPLPFFFR